MKERILQILQDKHLTSAKLADLMQVQRSSISHILSGRNKPSMDFMEKLLLTFPSISGDWLLTGKGEMLKPVEKPSKNAEEEQKPRSKTNEVEISGLFDIPTNKSSKAPESQPTISSEEPIQRISNERIRDLVTPLPLVSKPTKKIKRIIIYYDDLSYEELFPAQ